MLERKYGWTIEADIHGMRVLEAKRELETLIGRADKSIREIVVIHGYHGGSALKNMVRSELRHPRIQQKILSLNQGETTLLLKKPQW